MACMQPTAARWAPIRLARRRPARRTTAAGHRCVLLPGWDLPRPVADGVHARAWAPDGAGFDLCHGAMHDEVVLKR